MLRPLVPHQLRVWDYVSTRDRIALFMKMRLGKSIISIRWAKHRLPDDANILIVGPLAVLPGWVDELELEGERATILQGTSRQKMRALLACQTRWVLVNPEGLLACPAIATDVAWDCVILDESTFITNPRSRTTKLVQKVFKDVRCKAILAGEPAPESALNFFEQMRFVFDEFMGCRTYYQFRHRYFAQYGFDWTPRTPGFKKRLRDEVRRLGYVLTAKQAGITFNKVYERRYVHFEPEQLKAYRRVRRDFATDDVEAKRVIVVVGWLTRMAGGCLPSRRFAAEPFSTHKLQEVRYQVCERFRSESLVVWFRYSDEIRFCREWLERENVCLRVIDGKTPLILRRAYVNAFNEGRVRVLLVQTRCARFGLNLSRANISIFYSNWWEWLTRAQAEARIEHLSKVGATLRYIDLITEHTYDEAALEALKDKKVASRYFLQRVMVKYDSLSRRSGCKDDGHVRFERRRKDELEKSRHSDRDRSGESRGPGSKRPTQLRQASGGAAR